MRCRGDRIMTHSQLDHSARKIDQPSNGWANIMLWGFCSHVKIEFSGRFSIVRCFGTCFNDLRLKIKSLWLQSIIARSDTVSPLSKLIQTLFGIPVGTSLLEIWFVFYVGNDKNVKTWTMGLFTKTSSRQKAVVMTTRRRQPVDSSFMSTHQPQRLVVRFWLLNIRERT